MNDFQQAETPSCQATTKGGNPCKGKALPGSPFCMFHDPAKDEARRVGRKRGGRTRGEQVKGKPAAVSGDTEDVALESIQDVIALLAATINAVRRGKMEPKVGNCLGVLAGQLIKALNEDLAGELAAVRQLLQARLKGETGVKNGQCAAGAGEAEAGSGLRATANGVAG
jgi:hypothetical protein